MASEDPIQPDGSTVHRSGDSPAADPSLQKPLTSSAAREQMEAARTVIRGSSRVESAAKQIDRRNQSPVAVAKVLLGKHLNHFYLEELIGGGGMGAVFRAHDDQLDREVAIKVIPFVGDDTDLQRRFRNEAQSAAKLDHPRIARVFDVGNQDDWYYIVFEYIRGTNIRDLVADGDGALSIDDSVFYTCQVAEALQHAADRGIVHRDIKPSNVLIRSDGSVKLVDMGLARSDRMDLSKEDETASGVTLGTFDYISPEQAKDPRAADLRSDIYSLGCTLYFMLTTQPPYPGGTMLQKLLSHGNSPPPDARFLRNECSYELSAIIQKMLAKEPEQRYQTATDLIADLRELAFREGLQKSQGIGAVASAPTNPFPQWLQTHLPWLSAAALLLASVIGLQLSAPRDGEFSLTRPQSVIRPAKLLSVEADPPDTNMKEPVPDDSLSLTPPKTDSLNEVAPNSSTGSPADPPSMANFPVPDELVNPRSPGVVDSSLQTAMEVPNASDSPADQAGTPRMIRVVSDEFDFEAPQDGGLIRADDGAALTKSLAGALQLAQEYKVDQIQLATSLIFSQPVVIPRDDMVISSTAGGTTIVFKEPKSAGAAKRLHMIELGSNQIEFEDVHLVWNVSSANIGGGALIGTNENKRIRMTDCSMTIRNLTNRADVVAVDVITGDDFGQGIADGQNQLPLIAIQLYNVIVRGQISMIQMDYAAALQLQWENGLLSVSGRMIETAGALDRPAITATPIQLSLSQVTARAPLGILQMRLDESAPFPVRIDRDARSSVFWVQEGVPHIQIFGLNELDSNANLVQLRGEANAYKVSDSMQDPLLQLTDSTGQSLTTTMADLLSQLPNWFSETSPVWSVRWSTPELVDIPPDRLTPMDYRQNGALFSGFDENQLPSMTFSGGTDEVDSISTDRDGDVKNVQDLE